jgi:acyl carrier protein
MGNTSDINILAEPIRKFLLEKFPLAHKRGLSNGARLLEEGIVDSLGILDLVSFLETEFAIVVSDEELLPENFQTIERLAAFVQRKGQTSSKAHA